MIQYRDGYKYQLAADYTVQVAVKPAETVGNNFLRITPAGELAIRAGYAWDGPSGPSLDTRNFMRGSLVHDALYQLMRERLIDCGWRETADGELRRICREDGMSWIRAWWVYQAVRLGGEGAAKWQKECIITAP